MLTQTHFCGDIVSLLQRNLTLVSVFLKRTAFSRRKKYFHFFDVSNFNHVIPSSSTCLTVAMYQLLSMPTYHVMWFKFFILQTLISSHCVNKWIFHHIKNRARKLNIFDKPSIIKEYLFLLHVVDNLMKSMMTQIRVNSWSSLKRTSTHTQKRRNPYIRPT